VKREKGSNLWLRVSDGTQQTLWMARPLRIEYPGAVYHVMNRGNARHAIVFDDADRKLILIIRCQEPLWYRRVVPPNVGILTADP